MPAETKESAVFDIAKGKQDYVAVRFEWKMAELEHDRLLNSSMAATERFAANPQDIEAKTEFLNVQEQIEMAKLKVDHLGKQMRELADELLFSGDNGQNAY